MSLREMPFNREHEHPTKTKRKTTRKRKINGT